MIAIKSLYPHSLWENFFSLTQIPRPSKKEDRASAFAQKYGKDLGLETIVDEVGNVIIRKPATPGMEKKRGVVLQAHLDMVPQKNSDKVHDFEKDPIRAYVEGEWVTAEGTTLGADNGIGVSAALAILADKSLKHGPLEVLLTIDEETGMTGAFGLKPGLLRGEILLNLDSEDEGELYIGCAGGMNTSASLAYKQTEVPSGMKAFEVALKGLKGGHSGLDINLGRGNANKVMFRFLWHASREFGMRLASVEGGSLRNAIPREAFATVVVPEGKADEFLKSAVEYEKIFKHELSGTEPDLSFGALPADMPATLIDQESQERLIKMVYGIPNGVIRMSTEVPGIVETSNNLAIVKTENGEARVFCLIRSSVDSAKFDTGNMAEAVMSLAGAKVVHDGIYPGWKPDMKSPILNTMKNVYKNKYGSEPEIKVIHAGLECGIIGDAYPGMDLISFGPTIRFPHSPDEKVNIESVGKFWDYLIETLANIPEK